jgi:voltage-gated potassium channel
MRPEAVLSTAATLVGGLVLYFAVPLQSGESVGAVARNTALALLGVAVVATVVVRQLRGTGKRELTALQLVLLLQLVTIAFSLAYYSLAVHGQGQFEGIETRLDALYFTMTAMTTTGFGDVHPTGQVARAVVTGHLAFDVVFLALLAQLIRRRFVAGRA